MDSVIHQMQKADVTTSMLTEVGTLYDYAMRMTGASDAMQGRTTQQKRTLGEVQQANIGGSARMGFYAQLIDSMAITQLAQHWITNRQQFTEQEQFVRITGEFAREMSASADPRYGAQPGTASFCNADDDLLPLADLWLHGHLHCRHDYVVPRPGRHPTRVVCHARGMADKGEADGYDALRLIDL